MKFQILYSFTILFILLFGTSACKSPMSETSINAVSKDSPSVDETFEANICDRTPKVRDGILRSLSDSAECDRVTPKQLRNIHTLNIWSKGFIDLKTGDFDNLSSLESLSVSGNNLSSLPVGVFDNLYNLEQTVALR